AGITSAAVAWVGGEYLIGDDPTIAGYSWTFMMAFVLTTSGLMTLLAMREPEPPTVRVPTPLGRRLKELPALLRADRAFARYVLARALATLGRMAAPFYILFAGREIGLSGTTLAVLTIAFTLSGTVANLLWGALADRHGFRLAFLASIALWVASTLGLMLTSGLVPTTIVFVGLGAAFQGFQHSAMNLTLEFGSRDDLPMRIALANSGSELAGTIGPLLGGLLAAALGYGSVFVTSMAFLTIGGIMVACWVPEPRHAARP
ncbi:MAG: MFS transporter, partial [Pseudomonadales bacterium]|nr:MFS transporter [Pseudomonadales bacterium]